MAKQKVDLLNSKCDCISGRYRTADSHYLIKCNSCSKETYRFQPIKEAVFESISSAGNIQVNSLCSSVKKKTGAGSRLVKEVLAYLVRSNQIILNKPTPVEAEKEANAAAEKSDEQPTEDKPVEDSKEAEE